MFGLRTGRFGQREPPKDWAMDPASCRRGSVSDEGGVFGLGGVTEWLMVADCKSAGLTPYVGSNPTPTIGGTAGRRYGGRKTERSRRASAVPTCRRRTRGCSSVGRASAFQAEGRGFESRRPLRGRAYALTHDERDPMVPWTQRRAGSSIGGEDGEGGEGCRHAAVPPGM
jgi:hypothetical protein